MRTRRIQKTRFLINFSSSSCYRVVGVVQQSGISQDAPKGIPITLLVQPVPLPFLTVAPSSLQKGKKMDLSTFLMDECKHPTPSNPRTIDPSYVS